MKKQEVYKSKYLTSFLQENLMSAAILFYTLGILFGILAFTIHVQLFNYFSFFTSLLGTGLAFMALYLDISKYMFPKWVSALIPTMLVVLYIYQRWALPDFSFTVSDASDYYLSGINNILNKTDIGFFLPLTASVASTGYLLFGQEYLLYYFVMLYIFILPVIYFIGKELKFSSLLSLGLASLLIISPMSIWFSKTSFSESLWQVLLLAIILHSLTIITSKKISIQSYIILALLLLILPFSRGEAVLISGYIFFMSLYHFWKFGKLQTSLIVLSSLVFLFLAVQYTVYIRPHYLLTWQFSRVIPQITAEHLTLLLYVTLACLTGIIFMLSTIRNKFKTLPLPMLIVIFALLFKVIIAAIYTEKKHLSFMDAWLMNEFSFAIINFGVPVFILSLLGLFLIHKEAIRQHSFLALVVSYAIFSLPFIMQTTSYTDDHQFFMYWSRYYYSYLMLIYIFAIGLSIQYIYKKLDIVIKTTYYKNITMSLFLIVLFSISYNSKLNSIVSSDRYLHNSSELVEWIVQKVPNTSVSIVFPTNISYGNYDIKQLIRRNLTIHNIHVNYYYKVYAEKLSKTLELADRVYTSQYIICFTTKECLIDEHKFNFIEKYTVNIPWRKHESEIEKTKIDNLNITAYLYKRNNF